MRVFVSDTAAGCSPKTMFGNAPELADAHRASDERKSVSSPMSSEQVGVVHQFADWQRRLEGYLFGSVVAQRRDGCLALQTKSLRFVILDLRY